MTRKEVLIAGIGALLLTNTSIGLTLFLSGHFGDETPEEPEVVEEVVEEEPPPPPPPPKLHSLSKAMAICDERIQKESRSKRFSYQYDHLATHYKPDQESYSVFAETHSAITSNEPEKRTSIICEVSTGPLAISGYKVLPLK